MLAADSGKAALATWEASAGEIDLVLTDLVMPGGMNGLELAEMLSTRRPDLKIIIATGHGRDLDLRSASLERCEVLHKPVDADTLHAAIRACLDR